MTAFDSSTGQPELSRNAFRHGSGAETDPAQEQTSPAPFSWTPSILSSFPSPVQVLRGMARRWLLTLFLGVAGGTLLAAACWRIAPNQYRAEAWIAVQSLPPDVSGNGTDDVDLPTYLTRQQVLLASPRLWERVYQHPEVVNFQSPHSPEERKGLVGEGLAIEHSPEQSTIKVHLTGDHPAELDVLLKTAIIIYFDDLRQVQMRVLEQLRSDLRHKQAALLSRAKPPTPPQPPKPVVDQKYIVARQKLQEVKKAQQQVEADLQRVHKEESALPPVPTITLNPQNTLQSDRAYQTLLVEVERLESELKKWDEKLVRGRYDPSVKPYLDEYLEKQKLLEQRKIALAPSLPEDPHALTRERLQTQRNFLGQQRNQLFKEQMQYEEDLRKYAPVEVAPAKFDSNDPEWDQLESTVTSLKARIAEIERAGGRPCWISDLGRGVALTPESSRRRWAWTSLGGLFGFILPAGLIGFVECRRRRLTRVNEVAQGLSIPLAGTTPGRVPRQLSLLPAMWESQAARKDHPSPVNREEQQAREAVDVLRTLVLKRLGDGPCVVLITSAQGAEGKTTLACQLALSLAGSWRKTLLLDAALRKPAVHHMFHNPCEPGFSELLRGEVEPDDVVQSTPVSRLWIVPAGQSDNHAMQALAQERTAFLMEHFRKQYDCVVIDAGPVLSSADALLLGQHVDAVLLVARTGWSSLRAIHAAHEHLHSLELPVLGCVVVGASTME